MIKEQEILDFGFRIFGIEEDDPYYKLVLKNRFMGRDDIVGNFNENGFEIYSMNKIFSDINELKILFLVCDLVINRDITNRYGSDEPIRDEEYEDKPINTKTTNEFIVDLLQISNDKKQLPLVIQAPNKEFFPPQTKLIWKDDIMFTKDSEFEKLIITY
jgi:hypothetical protein